MSNYLNYTPILSGFVTLFNELGITTSGDNYSNTRALIPCYDDPFLYEIVRKCIALNTVTCTYPDSTNQAHIKGEPTELSLWQQIKSDYFSLTCPCDYIITNTVRPSHWSTVLLYGYKLARKGVVLGGTPELFKSSVVVSKLPPVTDIKAIAPTVSALYPKEVKLKPYEVFYYWQKPTN